MADFNESVASSPAAVNMTSLPEDMQFNDGHRISLVGYGSMFVVSSAANLRVLYLLRRRYALKKVISLLFWLSIKKMFKGNRQFIKCSIYRTFLYYLGTHRLASDPPGHCWPLCDLLLDAAWSWLGSHRSLDGGRRLVSRYGFLQGLWLVSIVKHYNLHQL